MLNKLGKLLKYEFRFYFRLLPPLYLALGLMAFLAGIQVQQSDLLIHGMQGSLLTVLWAAIITALTVMNIVLIIQRFTDNFMKNPGSLMFTLPVTSWALTASKAIAALCIVLISVVVILVSALIYAGITNWPYISINIDLSDSLALAFSGIAMILQQICLLYAVICAIHLLPRFRFAAGVVLYFVIMNFLVQPVLKIFRPFEGYPGSILITGFEGMIPSGIAALVFAAIFFCATGFLLKHRLDLE